MSGDSTTNDSDSDGGGDRTGATGGARPGTYRRRKAGWAAGLLLGGVLVEGVVAGSPVLAADPTSNTTPSVSSTQTQVDPAQDAADGTDGLCNQGASETAPTPAQDQAAGSGSSPAASSSTTDPATAA